MDPLTGIQGVTLIDKVDDMPFEVWVAMRVGIANAQDRVEERKWRVAARVRASRENSPGEKVERRVEKIVREIMSPGIE